MQLAPILALVLALFTVFVAAQPPIPLASSVFALGDADAAIKLEAFVDLQCPDSKAVWPILLQLAKHYGPHKLQLVATLFPLPYHHNAFFAAQARPPFPELARNNTVFWDYAQYLYDQQDNWGDEATQGIAPLQVITQMSRYAQACCKVDPAAFVKAMGWVSAQNLLARVTWKRAASLGIYGTPQFMINGVSSSADESWTMADWRKLLDPLLL
ncbi:uncharacterized protein ACA1_095270 [Acanthamoeba castellanii str. Neff]|uniref:Thioredoxin-like fold domain-containing protein n=1 Tax=Acanthamoeba castellanii (strain ATCC 30010 / Neff) TaxID=1257118 RepID=L8GIR9_ACACF|nr:uncharacterized protein ACA1_095270 [Acanthamoeba castellanii str. Neff]ELR12897.1 hypothetical protein ACA1_095270 [Acanthamoeba castellanii str. Neff]